MLRNKYKQLMDTVKNSSFFYSVEYNGLNLTAVVPCSLLMPKGMWHIIARGLLSSLVPIFNFEKFLKVVPFLRSGHSYSTSLESLTCIRT